MQYSSQYAAWEEVKVKLEAERDDYKSELAELREQMRELTELARLQELQKQAAHSFQMSAVGDHTAETGMLFSFCFVSVYRSDSEVCNV